MAAPRTFSLSYRDKCIVLCAAFLVLNFSFLYFAHRPEAPTPCGQCDQGPAQAPKIVTLKQAEVRLPSSGSWHSPTIEARSAPRWRQHTVLFAPSYLESSASNVAPLTVLLTLDAVNDNVESYVEDLYRGAMAKSLSAIVLFTPAVGMERCRRFNPSLQVECRQTTGDHPVLADVQHYLSAKMFDGDSLLAFVDDAGLAGGVETLQEVHTNFSRVESTTRHRGVIVGAKGYVRSLPEWSSSAPRQLRRAATMLDAGRSGGGLVGGAEKASKTQPDPWKLMSRPKLFGAAVVATPFITQAARVMKLPFHLSVATPPALLGAVADAPSYSGAVALLSEITPSLTNAVVHEQLWAKLLTEESHKVLCTADDLWDRECHKVVFLLEDYDRFSALDQATRLRPLVTAFLEQKKYAVTILAASQDNELSGKGHCAELLEAMGAESLAYAACERTYSTPTQGLSTQGLSYLHVPAQRPMLCEALRSIWAAAAIRTVNAFTSGSSVLSSLKPCVQLATIDIPEEEVEHAVWISKLHYAALQHWNTPKLTASIITNTRPRSLQRLLQSLEHAIFLGDSLDISFNMDAGADKETIQIAEDFHWAYGKKTIRHRVVKGGLITAVTESWFPASNNEWNFFLEDDISVSPYFYIWAKYALLTYQYGAPEDRMPDFMGVSLYTPRMIETAKERFKVDLPTDMKRITGYRYTPFLDQVPCSWGALYSPTVWKEFRNYLRMRLEQGESVKMNIPGSRINGWKGSWKKYLMEMSYSQGLYMLYPNFKDQESLATNHLEPGEHIRQPTSKTVHLPEDFTVPLMDANTILEQLPNGRLPHVVDLPRYNIVHDLVYKPPGSKR